MQDKFTFNASAGAMAGPVGRATQAETDAQLHAEILAYSRSRGLFAGIDLGGATLRPDHDDNRALYGRDVTPREILTGTVTPPPSAGALYSDLNRYRSGTRASRSFQAGRLKRGALWALTRAEPAAALFGGCRPVE